MTSSFKTRNYSIFGPILGITGLHVPYEQASEMDAAFFKKLCILAEISEYTHAQKRQRKLCSTDYTIARIHRI